MQGSYQQQKIPGLVGPVNLFEGSMSPKSTINGPCSPGMYGHQPGISLHAPENILSSGQVNLFEGSMRSPRQGLAQFPSGITLPCSSVMYEQQRGISLHAPVNTLSAGQVSLLEGSMRDPRLDPSMSLINLINSSTHHLPNYTEARPRTLSRDELELGYLARQGAGAARIPF
jgi:hypothetical protein